MKHSVTSFIGVIGSGKDHQARLLKEKGHVWIDFKDDLLDFVSDIVGYNVREDYEWFKEAIVGVKRPANGYQESYLREDMKKLLATNPELMTGRRLLTRFGTEGMRKRDPDYWVKRWNDKAILALADGNSIANADTRFFNEVLVIKQIHSFNSDITARFVFCDYRSPRYDPKFNHGSEKLAQTLLGFGLKDGDEITDDQFEMAATVLGASWPARDLQKA